MSLYKTKFLINFAQMGTLRTQKYDFMCILKNREKNKNQQRETRRRQLWDTYIGAKKRNKPETFPEPQKKKIEKKNKNHKQEQRSIQCMQPLRRKIRETHVWKIKLTKYPENEMRNIHDLEGWILETNILWDLKKRGKWKEKYPKEQRVVSLRM